jgi:N-formylglutamate amidohydrolase
LDDAALDTELLRMTDSFTDELFPATPVEADRVIFPLSRLVCDVERFPADEDEPMAARGMGVSYIRTSFGDVLRAKPEAPHRQALLDRWYWPHHAKLERAVNDVVTRSGACLIVDCHSFASVALPYELDQTSERADICVGTDSFHTPPHVRFATHNGLNSNIAARPKSCHKRTWDRALRLAWSFFQDISPHSRISPVANELAFGPRPALGFNAATSR